MATTGPGHVPVMIDRVLALLAPALQPEGSVLLDATLGRAGHAGALLSQHPGLTLIGVDADDAAIEQSRTLLAPYAGRVTLVRARYDAIREILSSRAGRRGRRAAAPASRGSCSTSAFRRHSSMTPIAASPTPRTRRWTCGWTSRAA
jgi:hypothetical protein